MPIKYFERDRLFSLETKNTSYIISITDIEGFIGHVYYGKKIIAPDCSISENIYSIPGAFQLTRVMEPPYVPSKNNRDRSTFLESFSHEYAGNNTGDFRESAISIKNESGHSVVQPLYQSHSIYNGKNKLEGLPACFGSEDDCTTLEINCLDKTLSLEIILVYTVFEECDAITRSVRVKNNDKNPIHLEKVMSLCLDMDNNNFDLITLHGSWARERHIQRQPVGYGFQGVSSVRGETGHQDHPFLALAEHDTNQSFGDIYGFSFVYSGNYLASASLSQADSIRVLMGINPDGFSWKLEKGETFVSPEAILVYSSNGLDKMTQCFHDLFRNHLIRGEWANKRRPVLINNWEATYFDFNTDKLLSIAKEASSSGIEMLVMDDGWFGNRSSDNSSLGDWQVNEKKLTGGLSALVEKVNGLGMKFGIWFEPEMISPDSDLYRAHKDWAISVPNRNPCLARNQLVLDLTRPDAFNYVWNCLSSILKSANIEYVKWDMNRPISDCGSSYLPVDRQGELYHRQVLAVYALQEKLITEFPHILLENCSGGGARFDAGMLFYSPQIWCSDDTDAIERLSIQEGTAIVYPLSCIGSHVSDCPNHITGRVTPFTTRAHVALAGTFGYELDVTRISKNDRTQIPAQIALSKKISGLTLNGDYYRLASYRENGHWDVWEVASKNGKEAIVTVIEVSTPPVTKSKKLKLRGLNPSALYSIHYDDGTSGFDESSEGNAATFITALNSLYPEKASGSLLMNAGLLITPLKGDYQSLLVYLSCTL